jgi:lysophospholipase L1-like esterase
VKIYELEWRDGIGAGSRVLSPIGIDHWIPNVPANLVVGGSPTLKIYNASKPGSASSYWTEANLKKALPIGLKAVILAHGHNDLVTLSQNFDAVKTIFDGLRTRVNSAVPNASVSLSTQNPVASTFRHYYMQNAHVSSILQVAAGYGLPIIDVYSAMVDGGFTDSWVDPGDLIHPTWETYEWWGAYVYQILKS